MQTNYSMKILLHARTINIVIDVILSAFIKRYNDDKIDKDDVFVLFLSTAS